MLGHDSGIATLGLVRGQAPATACPASSSRSAGTARRAPTPSAKTGRRLGPGARGRHRGRSRAVGRAARRRVGRRIGDEVEVHRPRAVGRERQGRRDDGVLARSRRSFRSTWSPAGAARSGRALDARSGADPPGRVVGDDRHRRPIENRVRDAVDDARRSRPAGHDACAGGAGQLAVDGSHDRGGGLAVGQDEPQSGRLARLDELEVVPAAGKP